MAGDSIPYPERPKFFAAKFCRLMAKRCVAMEVGPLGFALLAIIAQTEDSTRYRRAITFFDGQLMPITGAGSQKVLAAARKRCVDAGWLHYEPGRKAIAGRYWVTIPRDSTGIEDTPIDDGEDDSSPMPRQNDVESVEQNGVSNGTNGSLNGDKTTSQRSNILPIPIPNPIPKETPTPSQEEIPEDPTNGGTFQTGADDEFNAWWAILPEDMHCGKAGVWNLYQHVRACLIIEERCSQTVAASRLAERLRAYLASPRGSRKKFRWSAKTFLADRHDQDEDAAWAVSDDEKKQDTTKKKVLPL